MLLLSRCDAPAVFDRLEESLNMISVTVEVWTEADWITQVPMGQDVRPTCTSTIA